MWPSSFPAGSLHTCPGRASTYYFGLSRWEHPRLTCSSLFLETTSCCSYFLLGGTEGRAAAWPQYTPYLLLGDTPREKETPLPAGASPHLTSGGQPRPPAPGSAAPGGQPRAAPAPGAPVPAAAAPPPLAASPPACGFPPPSTGRVAPACPTRLCTAGNMDRPSHP